MQVREDESERDLPADPFDDASRPVRAPAVPPQQATVRPPDEIDAMTAPDLLAEIQRAARTGARTVIVDLTEVRFCDLAAMRILDSQTQRLREYGQELVLHNASPRLSRTIGLLRATLNAPVAHPRWSAESA